MDEANEKDNENDDDIPTQLKSVSRWLSKYFKPIFRLGRTFLYIVLTAC